MSCGSRASVSPRGGLVRRWGDNEHGRGDHHGSATQHLREPGPSKLAKYIISANKVVHDSALPAVTQESVALRVSQINGCAACVDMHPRTPRTRGKRQCGSIWSRCGGRRRSSCPASPS
nr:carboxymuconolactone decarboxylase family protein [Nonomuraea jiangxiensis]